MNTIVEFECLNPRDEFYDNNYSSFMFVIYPEMFPLLLSAESEDTIFDPDDVPIEESKVHSNPLFDDDEINSDESESHVESNFVESLSTHDALINSSQEIQNLEEISVVMNDIVEFECLDPNDKFDVSNDEDVNFFPFIIVIYFEVFSFLLSAESEDTIFDPGFTPH
nr:hypothetical protein [Tanacetum cinerariifolium]